MNPIVPVTLQTLRLILRPPVEEDGEVITRLVSDRRVAENALIPHPYPPGGAIEWIERSLQKWREGRTATFVICLREGEELIGAISLNCPENAAPNAGYWIGLAGGGQGYATEALRRRCGACWPTASVTSGWIASTAITLRKIPLPAA